MSPSPAADAFVGIGANLGNRLETIEACLIVLDDADGIAVSDVSGVYETAPWGGVDQPPYLNAVARLTTTRSPRGLLQECQATEAAFGRDRAEEQRWGPRVLDLDVLLYGDLVLDEPDLVVPHPRLTERAFVLVPLLEVFPGGELPDGTRITRLLSALAPLEGIDLHVRLQDGPGTQTRVRRPEGPVGPPPRTADQWQRPVGAPDDGVDR